MCFQVERSAIIFSMLSSSQEVSQVLASMGCLDVDDTILEGKVYVEMTALDREASDELNTFFQQKGATYAEAMVSYWCCVASSSCLNLENMKIQKQY